MKIDKIALMTWHHAENYGTAYQAYALKTIIERQGYHVDLIDYRRLGYGPLEVPKIHEIIISKLKEIFKRLNNSKINVFNFRKDTFNCFYEDNFTYTDKCLYNQDFIELNNIYLGFVCGSDQIWGPNWFDGRFFLDFVEDSRRMIAYAPSLGVSEILKPAVRDLMKSHIGRFANISVREKTGCEIVKKLTGRTDVYNVLDPVLMLEAEDWQKLEEPFEISGQYALIFFLANNSTNIKQSIDAAEKRGLKPVVLHCTQTVDTEWANVDELTPGQMLACIHNASYVFTDSFHVSVLSIIYHRQLMTFKKEMSGNGGTQYKRITDLFERLHINGGIYMDSESFDEYIDYSNIDEILREQRGESLQYLVSALKALPELSNDVRFECDKAPSCEGECTNQFSEYFQSLPEGMKKEFIRKCQFALKDKCYRCKNLRSTVLPDGRKPLFYYAIQSQMKFKHKAVYQKYYLPFHVLNSIKKIVRHDRII